MAPHHELSLFDRQFIDQQQELICVLKEEIVRLQDDIHAKVKTELDLKLELSKANENIAFLKEKI